jgi:prepilin-type N-terminal cleavage/methylation domain-containing protein
MIRSQIETNVETRRGLTLVELLVVVGVVSVLAAIVLPSIKTILSDRKSSQSAIMVKNFIEAARARAIGKNRSVAVVLERLSSRAQWNGSRYVSETSLDILPNAAASLPGDTNFVPYNGCIRLSLAEEPLPVTDQMMSIPVVIQARQPMDGRSPSIPTSIYSGEDALADADQWNGVPEVRIFRVFSPSVNDPNLHNGADLSRLLGEVLINGHEVSLGTMSRRFTIVSPRSPNTHQAFAMAGDGSIWFSVMNERAHEGRGERAMTSYKDISAGATYGAFKIYSRPQPTFTESITLPRGMCIDLSLSGFARDGQRNLTTTPSKQPVLDIPNANNPNPVSDYRVRFASDWIINSSTPPTPAQLRPVYIVFSPEGSLSHVWTNERNSSPGNTAGYVGNLVRVDAVQDIFLHLGKLDKINMPLDPDPQVRARNRTGFDLALASGAPQNLTDLNSYVIRLSPRSGAVSAAPTVGIDTQVFISGLNPSTLTFGDLIELSRRGAYNSNATAQ